MTDADSRRRQRLFRQLVPIAQLALGAAIIIWLVRTGRFRPEMYRELLTSDQAASVVGIILLQSAAFFTHLFRWWDLARVAGVDVPRRWVLRTGYQGLFASLVTPGSTGIDGIRLLYLQREHSGRRAAGVASILMDRLVGYIGLLVVGTIAAIGFALQQPGPVTAVILAMNGGLLLLMLLLAILSLGRMRMPGERLLRRLPVLARTMDALALYDHGRSRLAASIGLAVITHLLFSVAWCLGVVALGGSPRIAPVVAITAVLTIARTLPVTPMGLGVTDSLAEELYQLVSLDTGAELEMLIRITGMVIFLVSGLAFILKPPRFRHDAP